MDNRFGGLDGRRKGGIVSQLRRRLNPRYYENRGCNVAIEPLIPNHTNKLAEVVGTILGDGGITHNQLLISFNSEKDCDYSVYIGNLISGLFGIRVGRYKRRDSKCIVLFFSGVNLIKTLCHIGLKIGNKVKLQVRVPKWISKNVAYSRWCLRGLMDTDGGVFLDKYVVNRKRYCYKKICFTNKSMPLINFVFETLSKLGFNPQRYSDNKVWLYSYKEVERYLIEVGSSNQRLNKFKAN